MRKLLLTTTMLALAGTAHAQSVQTGTIGGMPYFLLPASGGCSAATPCSVVTYLGVQSETSGAIENDVNNYFGGAFAQANPHTIVIAPQENGPQDSTINWGGYNTATTPEQAQMVAVVQGVEQQMGNTVNPLNSVVTGGSLGGTGTQAALIAYGPKGQVQPGVFSAGVSFDAADYNAAGDPSQIAALCGVPLTAVHGTDDTNQNISYDQNLQSTIDGNASCNNSFTLVPIQGAGHGTWSDPSVGYQSGTGPGTPEGTIASDLNSTPARAMTASATPAAVGSQAATPMPTPMASPVSGSAPTTAPKSATAATTPAAGTSPAAAGTHPATTTPAGATTAGTTPATGTTTGTTAETPLAAATDDTNLAKEEIEVAQKLLKDPANDVLANELLDNAITQLDSSLQDMSTAQTAQPGATPSGTPTTTSPTSETTTPTPASTTTGSAATTPQAGAATTPPLTQTPVICGSGASSGGFHIVNGQIIGPDGTPFIARGVNVYDDEAAGAATPMTQTFTGLNFVRVNIHQLQDPSAYQSFITQFTSQGRVVELEHHPDGGGGQDAPYTGSQLAQESAWYASVAGAFANNPYVWFGTFNEPGVGDSGQLSAWHQATYQAIRGAGNNNPILIEPGGSRADNLVDALVPSVYAPMKNVIMDPHVYGYQVDYSTDQATNDANAKAMVAAAQTIPSADGKMGVMIAEYGNSTDGTNIDPNGNQNVEAVINVGAAGTAGSAAWAWDPGGDGDHLMNGSDPTNPYGQMVQLYVNKTVATCSTAQATTNANNQLAAVNAAVSGTAPTTATPAGTQPAAATPAAATDPTTDATIAQANAIVAAAQAQMQAALPATPTASP